MKKFLKKICYFISINFIIIFTFSLNKVNAATNENTKIYFLSNISQKFGAADCIIIEKNGRYGMIDSGRPETNNESNPYLNNWLKEKNIFELDFVIITHIHGDHIGGMEYLLKDESIKIDKIYLKKSDERSSMYSYAETLVNYAVKRDIPIIGTDNYYFANDSTKIGIKNNTNICPEYKWNNALKNGELEEFNDKNTTFDFQGDKIELFNYGLKYTDDIINDNDRSLGILITQGNKKAFFAGDICNYKHNLKDGTAKGTEDLIANKIGKVDFLKVGHHGYTDSSTSNFLNTLHPEYAVITNDIDKTNNDVIERLNKINCKYFYTTQDSSSIIVSMNEEKIKVEYEHPYGYKLISDEIKKIGECEKKEVNVNSWDELKKTIETGNNLKINLCKNGEWNIDQKIILKENQYVDIKNNNEISFNRVEDFKDNFFYLNYNSELNIETDKVITFDGKNIVASNGFIENNHGTLVLKGNIYFKNSIRETVINLNKEAGLYRNFSLQQNSGVINSSGIIKADGIEITNNSHKFIGNVKIMNQLNGNCTIISYGGGICSKGYLELNNCKINNNSLDSEISYNLQNINSNKVFQTYNNGAGIYYNNGKIINCKITENSTDNHSKYNLKNAKIGYITTTSYGGGMRISETSNSFIDSSEINNNKALNNTKIEYDLLSKFNKNIVSRGGGIYSNDSYCFIIQNSKINNNISKSNTKMNLSNINEATGGGINLFRPHEMIIQDSIIDSNSAEKGKGGGIMVDTGEKNIISLYLENNKLNNNNSKSGKNIFMWGNACMLENTMTKNPKDIYLCENYSIKYIENLEEDINKIINTNNTIKNETINSNDEILNNYNQLINKLNSVENASNLQERLSIIKESFEEQYIYIRSIIENSDINSSETIIEQYMEILNEYEKIYCTIGVIDEDTTTKNLNKIIDRYNENRDIDLHTENTIINRITDYWNSYIGEEDIFNKYYKQEECQKTTELTSIILEKKIKNKSDTEYKEISSKASTDLSKLTNKDIIVNLNLPSDKVKITNNNGSGNITFSKNGDFTYEMDIRGYKYKYKVIVNNIDKETPKLNIKSSETSISATATDNNLKELKVEKDGKEITYNQGDEITNPGIYKILAIDQAGNQASSKEIIYGTFKNSNSQEEKYIPINRTNTKVKDLIEDSDFTIKSEKNGTINSNNKEESNDVNVATGDKLIKNGQEYLLVVKGDITKDGEAGVLDLINLRKQLVSLEDLKDEQAIAADLDCNGEIDVMDLIMERKKIVGIE